MSSVAERLWDRIDPYVAAEGVELDDIEVLGGGKIVRVILDSESSIDVDRIASLSRGIGRLIDDDDPMSGSYTLEVSSPGLERKLRRPTHYRKSIGREVKITTLREIDGSKTHGGVLVDAGDTSCTVDVDGAHRTIPYSDVAAARTVFAWEKGARPGTNG